jgi:hypothetical protein
LSSTTLGGFEFEAALPPFDDDGGFEEPRPRPSLLSTALFTLPSLLNPKLVDGRGGNASSLPILSILDTGLEGGGNASFASATLSVLSVLWGRNCDFDASSEPGGLVCEIVRSVYARESGGAEGLLLGFARVGPSFDLDSDSAALNGSVVSLTCVGLEGDSGGHVDARLGGGFFGLASAPIWPCFKLCFALARPSTTPTTLAPLVPLPIVVAADAAADIDTGCTDAARTCTCFCLSAAERVIFGVYTGIGGFSFSLRFVVVGLWREGAGFEVWVVVGRAGFDEDEWDWLACVLVLVLDVEVAVDVDVAIDVAARLGSGVRAGNGNALPVAAAVFTFGVNTIDDGRGSKLFLGTSLPACNDNDCDCIVPDNEEDDEAEAVPTPAPTPMPGAVSLTISSSSGSPSICISIFGGREVRGERVSARFSIALVRSASRG